MVRMTNAEYGAYVKARCPASPLIKDMLNAFWVGGTICVLGQLIRNLWMLAGLDAESAGSAMSMTLVFLGTLATGLGVYDRLAKLGGAGTLLTGVGVYDRLAKLGGAGTLVPITGFANAMASPALEFKSEGLVTGLAAKMFIVAGPVIVYGVAASVVYGVIYWALTR